MRSLVLLVCLFPSLATAGNLYRCVSQSGHVSYQAISCPRDQRTDRRIEFTSEPAPPEATVLRPERKAAIGAKSHGARPHGIRGDTKAKTTSPCMHAKAQRERQLERLGLKRTFDDLSRIDARVRAVCEGF